MADSKMIATHRYECGRYTFTSFLPRVGTSSDTPVWRVTINDRLLPGGYETLEDAMKAALMWKDSTDGQRDSH